MYHNQIDMMSTQLQHLRVMLQEKEQEEQELKDKLTFECQNNVNLRAQLQEQVAHFETQIHMRDENARETYEEQNAQNQQMVTDLRRDLNAIKVNLESEKQKEIADALAKSQSEQLQKLEEECKMRLELQNQVKNNESRLLADEQMIKDLQQECRRQMELWKQEQEQKVAQEKLRLALEKELKLKEQQKFCDALLSRQLAEEEKQRAREKVLDDEIRSKEREKQKQEAREVITSLVQEPDNHLSVLDDGQSNRLREQIFQYVPPTVVQCRGGAKYAGEARLSSIACDSIRTSDVFDEDNLPTPPTSCITDVGSGGQNMCNLI